MLKLLFLSFNRRQELLDCVTHMRLLAWLLHGSLSHFVHCQNPHVNCHPVKFEENTHIADYVLIILFSFAEQLKVCYKSFSLKFLKVSLKSLACLSDCSRGMRWIIRDLFRVQKVLFSANRGCCVIFLRDSWTRHLPLSSILHKEGTYELSGVLNSNPPFSEYFKTIPHPAEPESRPSQQLQT